MVDFGRSNWAAHIDVMSKDSQSAAPSEDEEQRASTNPQSLTSSPSPTSALPTLRNPLPYRTHSSFNPARMATNVFRNPLIIHSCVNYPSQGLLHELRVLAASRGEAERWEGLEIKRSFWYSALKLCRTPFYTLCRSG